MLSLSPDGSLLCVAYRDRVDLIDLERQLTVEIAGADVLTALAFGDQAWVVCARAGGVEVQRYTHAGDPLGEPLALALGPRVEVRAARLGAPAVMLRAERTVEVTLVGGELVAHAIDCGGALALPIEARRWLVAKERVWLCQPGRELALDVPDEVLSQASPVEAWPLWSGAAIVVELRGPELHALVVIDLRSAEMRRLVRLVNVRAVRMMSARGHALLWQEDGALVVIDLRLGRPIEQAPHLGPIADVAVDERGERVVLQRGALDDEVELTLGTLGSLFATGAGDGTEEPAPAEPEPARAIDPPRAIDRPRAIACTRVAWPPAAEAAPRRARPSARGLSERRLEALSPWPASPPVDDARRRAALDGMLTLAAAWCKRAVADGWDSGRICQMTPVGHPFLAEIGALLDGQRGRAGELLDEAARHADELTRAEHARRADPAASPSPLDALRVEFGLSELALDVLVAVAAPSLWGELVRAYAIAANDPARPICDELLVAQLLGLAPVDRGALTAELDPDGPLVRHGLVRVAAGARPFAALSVPDVVTRRLAGEDFDHGQLSARVTLRRADRSLDELHLELAIVERMVAALAVADGAGPLRLVVRGRPGTGRRALLAALAEQAGRRLGVIQTALLAHDPAGLVEALRQALCDAALRGWLPCVVGLEFAAGEEASLAGELREAVRNHAGPIAFACGAAARPPIEPGHLLFDLPAISEALRAEAWRSSLARHGLPIDLADALAARHRLGPGTVERVVRHAAGRDDGATPGERLERAVRQHRDDRVGAIATRVERLASWSNVVLPSDLDDSLREFIGRVRHRRVVFDEWGFDSVVSSARGLTALFQGGPGTGKSMVAGVIARELGYELYRIDLGRLLSKWIGETEKNLAAVFDAAEDGEVVLLFDEADSLFAKRTDVKSSVDRYANVEVNYLLQRLDSFDGIAILTTNFGTSIDSAFSRRLSLRLTFPFPDEEMREKMWRVHLPRELPVEGELALDALARRYKLSGGYIRNATLRAAFLAAEEQRPLTQEHLERAVRLEYREVGKLTDEGVLE